MCSAVSFTAVKEEGCCVKTRLHLKYYPSRPMDITESNCFIFQAIQILSHKGSFKIVNEDSDLLGLSESSETLM